jgi:hypothetical protein
MKPNNAPSLTKEHRALVAQHELMLRGIKVVLVGAGLIIVLCLAWPQVVSLVSKGFIPSRESGSLISQPIHNTAVNTNFFGTDSKGLPFSVHASRVEKLNDEVIKMTMPQGVQRTADGHEIRWSGQNGEMKSQNRLMTLQGDAQLSYDHGYKLCADMVAINYDNSAGEGHGNIILTSDSTRVQSDSFEISDNYENIRFYGGRVKTQLTPLDNKSNRGKEK